MPRGQKANMRVHPSGLLTDSSLRTASSFINALSAVTFVTTQIFRVWKHCSTRSFAATDCSPAPSAALAAAKLFS